MSKRIVLKIGSSSLSESGGGLSYEKLGSFADAFCSLLNESQNSKERYEFVIVSSGAVAAGFPGLGLSSVPRRTAERQAAAAIGQSRLMQAYSNAMAVHGRKAAQILLTRSDFSNPTAFGNAFNVISTLIESGVVPIINENDTVAVEELNFGDNDMLAALVGALVQADMILWLTDTDGVYNDNPRSNPQAQRYTEIASVTDELIGQTNSPGSAVGTGGMRSKLLAARLATSLGVTGFIGRGHNVAQLRQALTQTGQGTYLPRQTERGIGRKLQWIAFHATPKGTLIIDPGAVQAISAQGRSLLAVGVVGVEGQFAAGDVVAVSDQSSKLLGRGIVQLGAEELKALIGKGSTEIRSLLDGKKPEVIHRDSWFQLDWLNPANSASTGNSTSPSNPDRAAEARVSEDRVSEDRDDR